MKITRFYFLILIWAIAQINSKTFRDGIFDLANNRNQHLTLISSPGNYILTNSINCTKKNIATITIDSDDVILDLQNNSIVNKNSAQIHGILVKAGCKNIIIKNGSISNFNLGCGIKLESENCLITIENICTHSNMFGIYTHKSNYITIKNSNFYFNQAAIKVYLSTRSVISDNKINQNNWGIIIKDCYWSTVYNCEFSDNQNHGFLLENSIKNLVENNLFTNNQTGFEDNALESSTIFIKNIARANNINFIGQYSNIEYQRFDDPTFTITGIDATTYINIRAQSGDKNVIIQE